MTTATARPRALKTYSTPLADGFVPPAIASAVGCRSGRTQARYYVTATSKRAAVERLHAVGIRFASVSTLKVTSENVQVVAIRDAGYLAEDGDVVVHNDHASGVRNLVRFAPGSTELTTVGQWTYIERIDYRGRRGHTFLVRLDDQARFPERYGSDPATPATGWVEASA